MPANTMTYNQVSSVINEIYKMATGQDSVAELNGGDQATCDGCVFGKLEGGRRMGFYAALEDEMLERINALGIGPQGFGGRTTAIGLNIETLPTHIAGMPCAININCHVTRHKSEVL